MRVLVTGGCGFLGSHVCEAFKRRGWDVQAYDNMTKFETSRISFGDQERIRNYNRNHLESLGILVQKANICHFDALMDCAKRCDYIINCAAQPTMTLSSEDPTFDFNTNVVGMVNILEVARALKVPVATCSSIHVYGTGINDSLIEEEVAYRRPAWYPALINEEHPVLTGQLTPLHASKRCAEIYARMYAETYGLDVAVFRLTGIYGERQFGSEDHGWVSLLAIKTMLGLPIQLIGTGKQVRDILYISDAVDAFVKWWEAGRPSGIYNIGGGIRNIISVRQCLAELARLFGRKQIITQGGTRRGDLLYFACDSSKARVDFGWQPTVTPAEGLERMVRWLQENRDIFSASSPAAAQAQG